MWVICSMEKNLQKFANSLEVNCVPLSETIVSGTPNLANISFTDIVEVTLQNFGPFRKTAQNYKTV